MDTLFAVLLGVIGLVLLAGAAALLWPALRGGRPPAPPTPPGPDLSSDADRQRRLAEIRQRRMADAGAYDFPFEMDESPQVQAHRLNDENMVVSPPGGVSGEILPADMTLPGSPQRRI